MPFHINNNINLIGYLGADPKCIELENGQKVASFYMATSQVYNDKTNNEKITKEQWHRITVWNGLAEHVGKYCKKGTHIAVTGLSDPGYYLQEGQKKFKHEVKADSVHLLGNTKKVDNEQLTKTSGKYALLMFFTACL